LPARGKSDRRFVRLVLVADPVALKRLAMKKVIVAAVAVLLVGLAGVVLAAPAPPTVRGKKLPALQRKMVGVWNLAVRLRF
jgi:hypothetical protein